MISTTVTAVLAATLLAAIAILIHQTRQNDSANFASLEREVAQSDLSVDKRIELRLAIERQRSEHAGWYARSISTMGVLAFTGALAGLITQTMQNATLEQKSALESEQLELFRAQTERAQKLMTPMVHSIVEDFDRRGNDPSQDEKELLRFAVDQALSAPVSEDPEYKANLLNVFRAALLSGEFAAAVRIGDRLGPDVALTNKVEQVSLIEYQFVSGYGAGLESHITALLKSPGELPGSHLLRLLALAVNMGVIDDREAIARAARGLRVEPKAAAKKLKVAGIALRDMRAKVLAQLRSSPRLKR